MGSAIVECLAGIWNLLALCHKLQPSDQSQIAGLVKVATTLYI